jgi:hypothetical protein
VEPEEPVAATQYVLQSPGQEQGPEEPVAATRYVVQSQGQEQGPEESLAATQSLSQAGGQEQDAEDKPMAQARSQGAAEPLRAEQARVFAEEERAAKRIKGILRGRYRFP